MSVREPTAGSMAQAREPNSLEKRRNRNDRLCLALAVALAAIFTVGGYLFLK